MGNRTGERVVHSYDLGRRQVRCGVAGQASSTKHAAGVTCSSCRELLDRASLANRRAGAGAPAPVGHGE